MKSATEILQTLLFFTGSLTWHKWSVIFPRDLLTDGAQYLAESCEAYWLMDAIASWQLDPVVKAEHFQAWTLDKEVLVDGKPYWGLTCTDGNGNTIALQPFGITSFPLEKIELLAVRNELGGITIMLPSEY